MLSNPVNMITVLGTTATGKTTFATHLAKEINGEIIGADSRQVYKRMNIGTGKDLDEYTIDGYEVKYHLIDIIDAGEKYNVFQYQSDFLKAYNSIVAKNTTPILCGGSGMYIEAVLKGYKLINVPVNETVRSELESYNLEELRSILQEYKHLHNKTDVDTKKRAIRAIEIAKYYKDNPDIDFSFPKINSLIFGIKADRAVVKERITERLKKRLDNGMIDEVESLLHSGISPDTLIYYGLEYKFITQYLIGNLEYNTMFEKLNIAIHQFSKRQMTWFRKMERNGFNIHWLDISIGLEKMINQALNIYSQNS